MRNAPGERTRALLARAIRVPMIGLFGALALQAVSIAQAACPRAVFFDLGNTLVEAGAGGLQVVRPGAQETVDALQAAGVRVGVITNVPAGFTRAQLNALLATPAFLDEFEVVVMSSEAPAAGLCAVFKDGYEPSS